MRFNISKFCDEFVIKFILEHNTLFSNLDKFNGYKHKIDYSIWCSNIKANRSEVVIPNLKNIMQEQFLHENTMMSKYFDTKFGIYVDDRYVIKQYLIQINFTNEFILKGVNIYLNDKLETIFQEMSTVHENNKPLSIFESSNDETMDALMGDFIEVTYPGVLSDSLNC